MMRNHRNEVGEGTAETQVWTPEELNCQVPV